MGLDLFMRTSMWTFLLHSGRTENIGDTRERYFRYTTLTHLQCISAIKAFCLLLQIAF